MLARTILLWLLVTVLAYLAIRVLSIPRLRHKAINGETVKTSTFLIIAGIVAALVVIFIQAAQKLI